MASSALVHNRHGECYLHASGDVASRVDESTPHSVLCVKANFPAHAYVLYPSGVQGRGNVVASRAALLRANYTAARWRA